MDGAGPRKLAGNGGIRDAFGATFELVWPLHAGHLRAETWKRKRESLWTFCGMEEPIVEFSAIDGKKDQPPGCRV